LVLFANLAIFQIIDNSFDYVIIKKELSQKEKESDMLTIFTAVSSLVAATFLGAFIHKMMAFNIECGCHIRRASKAATVADAIVEMKVVMRYYQWKAPYEIFFSPLRDFLTGLNLIDSKLQPIEKRLKLLGLQAELRNNIPRRTSFFPPNENEILGVSLLLAAIGSTTVATMAILILILTSQ